MKGFLQKETAGIKNWIWLALIIAAILVGLWWRHKSSTASTDAAGSDTVDYSQLPGDAAFPIPGTAGGGGGGAGAGGTGGTPDNSINVPNVVGLSKDDASKLLESEGFQATSFGTQFGKVSSQSPAAGTKAPFGSYVSLSIVPKEEGVTIKKPEQSTVVPNVVGLDKENAKQILKQYKLKVLFSLKSGIVKSQSPAAGTTALVNSYVSLTLDPIPKPVKNPKPPKTISEQPTPKVTVPAIAPGPPPTIGAK